MILLVLTRFANWLVPLRKRPDASADDGGQTPKRKTNTLDPRRRGTLVTQQLGVLTVTAALFGSGHVHAQAVPGAPANPTANCTWNWNYWRHTNSYIINDPGNYNPADPRYVHSPVTTTIAAGSPLAAEGGAGQWYGTTTAPDSQFSLGDNQFPSEVTSSTDGETWHAVGFFVSEPNSTRTIGFRDTGRNDGHVFAIFDSSGNQVDRFPRRDDSGGGSPTTPSYFAGPTNANAAFIATGGINVGTAWNRTFTSTISRPMRTTGLRLQHKMPVKIHQLM